MELVNVERLNARAASIKQEYAALSQIIGGGSGSG